MYKMFKARGFQPYQVFRTILTKEVSTLFILLTPQNAIHSNFIALGAKDLHSKSFLKPLYDGRQQI